MPNVENEPDRAEGQEPITTDEMATPFAVPGLGRVPIGQHPPTYSPSLPQSPGFFGRLFGGPSAAPMPAEPYGMPAPQQQSQFIPGPSSEPMRNAMMSMVPLGANMGLTPPPMGTGGIVMSSDVIGAMRDTVRGAKKKKTDAFHFRRYREE